MSRIARAFAVFALCANLGCPTARPPVSEEELQQEYLAAVQDASVAEPDEISTSLTAITRSNDALMWRDEAGQEQVLMVTWTSWTGYGDLVGQSYTCSRDIWVTAAPEVQDFVSRNHIRSEDLTLRLEELMGLPPDSGKTIFVEMWVNPSDLFRPSADPEITDHESELAFPSVTGYMSVTQAYVDWFTNLMGSSYGDGGYPWTRLGYTYDWGNPTSEVGLSEFVVRKGATVQIESVAPTQEYCGLAGRAGAAGWNPN